MTEARDVTPVILAGGSGTRLWPLSRASYPKQFARFSAGPTLFQSAVLRFRGPGFAPPLVVTAEPYRFIVLEQLDEIGVAPAGVLVEPAPKGTAPSVAVALAWSEAAGREGHLIVSPSDHLVDDDAGFRSLVGRASRCDGIVTFGIAPDRAETGYGWLELGADHGPDAQGPFPLARFVEKPGKPVAEEMLASGNFLWNAGIFLGAPSSFAHAFEAHAPRTLDLARNAFHAGRTELGFHRLSSEPWDDLVADSIDRAVMEKADGLSVLPWHSGWSDLGSWDAMWRAGGGGTVLRGDVSEMECRNCYFSAADGMRLVGIGLSDIVAVALPDAVLVTRRDAAQDVGVAVRRMEAEGVPQATEFPRSHRPWGWFETLVLGDRFRVKRIFVKPGGRLSLQSHQRRAEHWVVVEGTAQVTVADEKRRLGQNQSIYVPVGAKHRLENETSEPLVLVEVQTGGYLEEDDIVRYDDVYERR